MTTLSRRHTLIVGLTLIAATNAVALLGVGWNRLGEPESQLKLSQRELLHPFGWGLGRENSGLAQRLEWRVPSRKPPQNDPDWSYASPASPPPWLNRTKMQSLGFDMPVPAHTGSARRTEQQKIREVFLVLELDGGAYRATLEQIQHYAKMQESMQAANPDNAEIRRRVKSAHARLMVESQEASRLFVVDAGLDLNALRSQYPDRSRYALVRGQVGRLNIGSSTDDETAGFIQGLSIDSIHVPFAFRAGLEAVGPPLPGRATASRAPFEASVAFGQRLEPWITAAQTVPK